MLEGKQKEIFQNGSSAIYALLEEFDDETAYLIALSVFTLWAWELEFTDKELLADVKASFEQWRQIYKNQMEMN